jgi:hypothetical protein
MATPNQPLAMNPHATAYRVCPDVPSEIDRPTAMSDRKTNTRQTNGD